MTRIVKAIDVFEDGHLGLPSAHPRMPPDQLSFECFEERRNGRIVIALNLAAHRCLDAMSAQDLLVIVETVLRPTIRVMEAVLGWRTKRNRPLLSPDCQAPFHPMARGPTNNAARMQVEDDCEIQPALTRPDS